jgi:hypothetical protein
MRYLVIILSLFMVLPCMATTICWDGKTLATDSQRTGGIHRKILGNNKMVRSEKRHAVMAAAGEVRVTRGIKKFFLESELPLTTYQLPEGVDPDSYECLVVYDDGHAELYTGDMKHPDAVDAPFAFGSGEDFAFAALHLGKNAEDAIKVAEDLDLYTGGPIFAIKAPMPAHKP